MLMYGFIQTAMIGVGVAAKDSQDYWRQLLVVIVYGKLFITKIIQLIRANADPNRGKKCSLWFLSK